MVATLTHRMEAIKSAAGRLFGGGGGGDKNAASQRTLPPPPSEGQVRGGLARTSASSAAATAPAAATDPSAPAEGLGSVTAPSSKKVAFKAGPAAPPANSGLPLPPGAGGAAAAAARSADLTVHNLGFPRGLTDRYDLGQLLGAGGSGVVRVAVDKRTGKRWACKSIPKVREGGVKR